MRAVAVPKLAALQARLLGAQSSAFGFTGRTCVATVNPPQVVTLHGVGRLRPTLLIDVHENLSGRALEVRFIGSKLYIYLAEIASRDGGKPWLVADLKTLSSASGLNFGELLTEIQQFSPGRPSPLLRAAASFRALGKATIGGRRAYVYRGEFTPESLTKVGLPADLGKQTAAKLRQLGATREVATSYLTPAGVALRTVAAIYEGARLLTVTISGSSPTTRPVDVGRPPPSETIAYSKVIKS